MAHGGRRNADEVLAFALAAGRTLRQAARVSGVSERTAARRWADPDFRKRVSECRSEMHVRAIGVLADGMTAAAATLRRLLNCGNLPTRLGAARSLLELGMKGREWLEFENRLRAMEEKLNMRGDGR